MTRAPFETARAAPAMSDEDLCRRLREEPERAFAELYRRHSSPLFRFIYRFTGNSESAEEILHDIFIQLLSGKFDPSPESQLKAWLYAIARNRSLNHLRNASRRAAEDELSARASERELRDSPAGGDAESAVIERELAEKFVSLEARLPGELRETWSLRKQGMDYREIASRLSIPVGTVKSRFHRLVRFLRMELKNEI